MRLHAALLGASLAAAGCANVNSIYRPLDLHGSAVAVDAKQRGIYSVASAASAGAAGQVVLCPEPSPDALSAYAASGGLTGLLRGVAEGATPGSQLQAAFAAGESAASIGLRTQSIQLLRDGLFSNCLAFMNRAVGAAEFLQLQRRSQAFTLGLLAIEQLTGAVKAGQAALSTEAAAASGSDAVDKQIANVDAAQSAANAAQTKLEAARSALEESRSAAADATKARAKAEADQAASTDTSKEAKEKLQQAVDTAKADEKAKAELARQRQLAVNADARGAHSAEARLRAANEQLALAQGRARAAAGGAAELLQASSRSETARHISEAVRHIVDSVLDKAGLGETCTTLLEKVAAPATGPAVADSLLGVIGAACNVEIKVAAAAVATERTRSEQAGATAEEQERALQRIREQLRLPLERMREQR